MASTLPSSGVQCCDTVCCEPEVSQVPGPPGDDGDNGTNGADGQNAFTLLTAQFTMPAELGSAAAAVGNSDWMAVNEVVYLAKTDGSVQGYFLVTAISSSLAVTLKNLEDTTTNAYLSNSAPGSIFTVGSKLCAGGKQGPNGTIAGTAVGGDLVGTLPNPTLGEPSALGSILVGDGALPGALAAGANGTILVSDSTQPLGRIDKALLPKTGDTDVLIDRVARLSATTGLPIPLEASRMAVRDAGGAGTLVVDDRASVANPRGTDAIDLQTSRNAVTQVASGTESVLSGGKQNTAAATQCVIAGGELNSINAAAQESVISGGFTNSIGALGERAVIAGGDRNSVTGQEGVCGGGNQNVVSATQATVAGGDGNTASAIESTVGGGGGNLTAGVNDTVAGGLQNGTTGGLCSIGGGRFNAASGPYSTIPGGYAALADKHGQQAYASGGISGVPGEMQESKMLLCRATVDATPVILMLDGSSLVCTVPTGVSWMFQMMLVARKSDGLTSIYKSEGVITNVAGTVTMPAAATTTEIYDGIGLPATPVVVTADDPTNSISVTCTGIAATLIRWNAVLRVIEVKY